MEKIRGLEEEVSDADGAIDDAKAAIETLLEEKKAADQRIQDLKNERSKVDNAMEQLRKQMAANKKDQEQKMFKLQSESEELTHENLLLKMEKKELQEKMSTLEEEVNQAESAIGDAKSALQKLLVDKEEANRRIEGLEEDKEHAQATIEAMTKSMTQARVEYEAKIDSLMSGLTTAREIQASRSMAGDRSMALTMTESSKSSTPYSIPENTKYSSWKDRRSESAAPKKTSEEKSTYTQRDRSLNTFDRTPSVSRAMGSKRLLAVDMDNMTIASELTDAEGSKIDRSSASSSKYGSRSRSVGKDRSASRGDYSRFGRGDDSDSKSVSDVKSAGRSTVDLGSKLSNLDLARSFLDNKTGAPRSRSRARPQDRDTFGDDSDARSVGGRSLGGASLYTDSKSRSGKFGGNYDGDLNNRGERHGKGSFVAGKLAKLLL
jgi:predicted  nucleic acid-binding Zn-ribbon protein